MDFKHLVIAVFIVHVSRKQGGGGGGGGKGKGGGGGGGVWVHKANFWVMLTLHLQDEPDGFSHDRSQQLPWLQFSTKLS